MGTAQKSKSFLKKLFFAGSLIFSFIIIVAIAAPFLIDVDRYRPDLVAKINEQVQGKVELGKLSLTVWGRLRVQIEGLRIADQRGTEVLSVKEAFVYIPWMGLLTGAPELRFEMNRPNIHVVKLKTGQLNLLTLIKSEKTAESQTAGSSTDSKNSVGATSGVRAPVVLPGILLKSRFTIILDKANASYRDEATADVMQIQDLHFLLADVSPSSKMPFEISADVNMEIQKKAKLNGPLALRGFFQAENVAGELRKGQLNASLDLDALEISSSGVFHKKKGIAFGADFSGSVTKEAFQMTTLKVRLADIVLDAQASGKFEGEKLNVDFRTKSNTVKIEKLASLSPLISEYQLNGEVGMELFAKGPSDHLIYGGSFKLNKMHLMHESLKQNMELSGQVVLATNEIQVTNVQLMAKNFDVRAHGVLQDFSAPKFKFSISSNEMDLDGLLKTFEKGAEARKASASASVASVSGGGGAAGGAGSDKAVVVDYNSMFKPLKENPLAPQVSGSVSLALKKIKATGILVSGITGEMTLNQLVMVLKDLSLQIFDGTIKGGMSFNLKGAKPEFGSNLVVSHVETQKMSESQIPFARNTIKGAIDANINIGGQGLNHPEVLSNWKGGGNFNLQKATFSTLDIGKQVRDGVIAKLPEALKSKAKVPDSLIDKHGEYETVSAKFALQSGIFTVTELVGKAYPNKGLDVRGSGTTKLVNYALDMSMDIIDTYNLMHADEIARDSRYGHFTVSPKVRGTLFAPDFDWGSTVTKLAENAAKTKGKEVLQKAVQDKVPGALKNAFKGLFH